MIVTFASSSLCHGPEPSLLDRGRYVEVSVRR